MKLEMILSFTFAGVEVSKIICCEIFDGRCWRIVGGLI